MRTSEPGFEIGTLNAYLVDMKEIQTGDRYGYKVIAVVRSLSWSAYRGPTSWSDQQVAEMGDKVSRKVAEELFPTIAYMYDYQD